ncbi:MAG: glycosyltransferase, partial [Phycisphaerales bacterium]
GEAAEQFVGRGIVKAERTSLVRGSGVDLEVFSALPEPPGPPVVLFPSRMLWDKGLREFVQAARLVRAERRDVRFVLVGAPDPENRASASERDLQDIVAEGCCEWWGHRSDMAEVLGQCHVVVLPSYHEGLPKVLVEAAAVGRVVVTSDIPGCRAALTHPSAGRLVPVRDAAAIAAAVIGWLDDPAERRRAARAAVEGAAAFATPVIQEQFLELWGARR